MQANPRLMESAHAAPLSNASPLSNAAPARPLTPPNPLSPSVSSQFEIEHDSSSPEPYWPRLARALVLMFFAISLHIWGVKSPDPQEPFYSALATRVISSMLVSPPLPLAPPLQIVSARPARHSASHVTLQTTLLNVPMLPGPPPSAAVVPQRDRLAAVATTGTVPPAAVDTADVERPHAAPPPTAAKAVAEVAASTPGIEPRSAKTMVEAPPLVEAPAEHRAALSAAPPLVVARETPRAQPVALPLDRKEADPRETVGDPGQQTATVLAVVHAYARALERQDVRAIKAVYPSADGRMLQHSFDGVEKQQFHFATCGVSISSSGDDANARCKGNATYRPKVGSRVQRMNGEWVFSLSRDGSGWQILEARGRIQ